MKLLSTAAVGALLLSACAPFEHGHYGANVNYQPPVAAQPYGGSFYNGAVAASSNVHAPIFREPAYSVPVNYSRPVEIVQQAPIVQASYVEPVVHHQPQVIHHQAPVVHHEPQVIHHQAPVVHHEPQVVRHQAPVVHHQPQVVHHQAPIIHHEPQQIVQHNYAEPLPYSQPVHQEYQPVAQAAYPAPLQHVESASYVEPHRYVNSINSGYEVAHHAPAPIEYAPPAAPLPIAKPLDHHSYVEAQPIHQQPPVYDAPPPTYGTSVSVEEQRIEAPIAYAPPQVVNAPPVYMRGAPQYANQPYPAPAYPQFGAPFAGAPYGAPPAYGYPQPPAQPFGYPQPAPAFGGGYGNPYGGAVPANLRPYPTSGYNGGYNNPYGPAGCVTTCVGSSSVF